MGDDASLLVRVGVPGSQCSVDGVAHDDLGDGQHFLKGRGQLQVPPVELKGLDRVVVAGIHVGGQPNRVQTVFEFQERGPLNHLPSMG